MKCGQCGAMHSMQNRVITEQCGHKKCRQCFIFEEDNCRQCHKKSKNNHVDVIKKSDEIVRKINKNERKKRSSQLSHIWHIKDILSPGGVIKYQCMECNKIFGSRSQKYYHLSCGKQQKDMYKCDKCEQLFFRRSYLKYHMESHSKVVHSCSVCQKVFRNRLVLRKHEKLHKLLPRKCSYCDKSFRSDYSLTVHIAAIHTKQLPYHCTKCLKRYASKSTLQQHILKHESNKHYCTLCGKSFQRKSSLKLHIKRHNKSENYCCTTCWKQFTDPAAYQRHVKQHQISVKYVCKLCNTSTLRKDNMLRHIRNFHSNCTFEQSVDIITDRMACDNNVSCADDAQNGTTKNVEIVNLEMPTLKTVANSTVIKYIGNVEPVRIPQLESNLVQTTLTPLRTIQNFNVSLSNELEEEKIRYKQRISDNLFNIELYRRILEDDDNSDNESNKNNETDYHHLNTDIAANAQYAENVDNMSVPFESNTQSQHLNEEKRTTLHWRKSFKYNYELTEF